MKKILTEKLAKENAIIEYYLAQVTSDPPLMVAQNRAALLRELLNELPPYISPGHHSAATIQEWLTRIVGHEGGYWDDPVGGPTKWGISQRAYPDLDIKSLTVQDAEQIYRRDYLAPLHADRLAAGVAYQLLDFAVNSGPAAAVKQLQKILGITADGNIGPDTLDKIAEKTESDLVMLIIAARLKFMISLKNWPANSRGWTDRMANNLLYAVADTD